MPCQTHCTAWPYCVCERPLPLPLPTPLPPFPTIVTWPTEDALRRIIREEIANATGEITDAVSREIGRRVARRRNG